jgi:hypothetical protein
LDTGENLMAIAAGLPDLDYSIARGRLWMQANIVWICLPSIAGGAASGREGFRRTALHMSNFADS